MKHESTNEYIKMPERSNMETALKQKRKNNGLTQRQVANKAEISVRAYQNYERRERVPDAFTAQLVAQVLNTTVEELFPLKENLNAKVKTIS